MFTPKDYEHFYLSLKSLEHCQRMCQIISDLQKVPFVVNSKLLRIITLFPE